jgi:cytochrome c peroxidase
MSRRQLLSATVFLLLLAVLLILGSGDEGRSVLAGSADTEPLWTPEEWARARRFSPLPPPPADPTNALADDLRAARLGHHLFFDTRLSPHGVSCATCHNPAQGFTDGRAVAHTLAPLHRNTMTILNAAYYRWLTWDGGRDSLWHQAIAPLENPHEMGSSRLHVVRAVMQHYAAELAEITALPAGWDALWPTLPAAGRPGEAAFDALPIEQQEAVNRLFATIVKLIAAYERQLVSAQAPFDRFVAGDYTALSPAAQRGFQHFLRFQCDTCHNTPLFSDDEFHNLGLPPVPVPDQGRAEGLVRLQQSPFRGTGPYADGSPPVRAEDYQVGQALLGSFRTPGLRELAYTAPYGHNGTIATLADWLEHYVQVTTGAAQPFPGTLDPTLQTIDISPQENRELVAFLQALSSAYTSAWTQPPVASQGRGQQP